MAASHAARFLPAGPTVVTWKEFKALAERHGLVMEHDEVGARHLLSDLLATGEVRVTGTYPALSVTRPVIPDRPRFTSTDGDAAERPRLMQVIENLRLENQRLRDRLAVQTGVQGA